jgi:hypothetical protein
MSYMRLNTYILVYDSKDSNGQTEETMLYLYRSEFVTPTLRAAASLTALVG